MMQDLPGESDGENLYLIKIKKCSQYCRILAFSLNGLFCKQKWSKNSSQ